jgi:urease accessory protein
MANGKVFARLAWVNGRTRLVEHRQSAPLKIARAFETPDGGLDICVMDASPGLLAGDVYEFEWVLEPGTRARITTQGATRVHPSGGSISRQTTEVSVAADAHLELWPESTIPFRDARFQSQINAKLEDGANLLIFESLSAGRVARDEIFAFGCVTTGLHIRDERGPRLFARNRFVPGEMPPQDPFVWGGATQWSNLYGFGPAWAGSDLLNAQSTIESYSLFGAASTLTRGDLAVSLLGRRAHDLRAAALEIAEQWKCAVSRETS